MTTTEIQVHMDCPGCENKVRKALEKLKGVDNVDIDMALQKVTVTGWAEQKKLLKTVRRTGRRAEIWQMPYNPELRNSDYNINVYNSQHHHGGLGLSTYNHAPPQPNSSSYNYYKHGYSTHMSNYSHYPLHSSSSSTSSSIFGHQTGAAFSDENPNACSIM